MIMKPYRSWTLSVMLVASLLGGALAGCGGSSPTQPQGGGAYDGIYVGYGDSLEVLPDMATGVDPQRRINMTRTAEALCVDPAGILYGALDSGDIVRIDPRQPDTRSFFPTFGTPVEQHFRGVPRGIALDS